MTGATISVTNLGDRGVDEVHGVIHPPELALVGIGASHHERSWSAARWSPVRASW